MSQEHEILDYDKHMSSENYLEVPSPLGVFPHTTSSWVALTSSSAPEPKVVSGAGSVAAEVVVRCRSVLGNALDMLESSEDSRVNGRTS